MKWRVLEIAVAFLMQNGVLLADQDWKWKIRADSKGLPDFQPDRLGTLILEPPAGFQETHSESSGSGPEIRLQKRLYTKRFWHFLRFL